MKALPGTSTTQKAYHDHAHKSHCYDRTNCKSASLENFTKAQVFVNTNKNSTFSSILSFDMIGTQTESNKFLLDSGASVSLLKLKALHDHAYITLNHIEIRGITAEPMQTLGTSTVKIIIPNHDNRTFPVTFHIVPNNFPISQDGIIGEDFLSVTKALIDYGNKKATFNFHNLRVPINFITEFQKVIIPPRSEKIIRYGPVKITEESVASVEKLIETGLFVSHTIVKPLNGFVYFSVLNVTESAIEISSSLNIKFSPLSDYFVYNLSEHSYSYSIKNRLEKLNSQLNLNHCNEEEKLSIRNICRKYNKLFHLEGDGLTISNATRHTISTDPSKPPINVRPYRLAEIHKSEIKK